MTNFSIKFFSIDVGNLTTTTSATNSSEPDDKWALSPPLSVLLIMDTVVTLSWSVFANTVILSAILLDPKLRTRKQIYGFSLALSDLLGSISLGFACYNFLYNSWRIENADLCKLWNVADYTCSLIASLSIALISYDRYKLVSNTVQYHNEETSRRVLGRAISVWIFSALFYIPTTGFWDLMVGYSVVAKDDCDPEYKDVLYMTVIQSLVEFFVPFAVILYCNVKIMRFMRQRSRRREVIQQRLKSEPRELTVFTVGSAMDEVVSQKLFEREVLKDELREIGRKSRISQGLWILIGVFFCLWFPWEVVGNFTQPICNCVPDTIYNLSYWIQYHMFAVNSIVYGLTNDRLRSHFKKVLTGIFPFARFQKQRISTRVWPSAAVTYDY